MELQKGACLPISGTQRCPGPLRTSGFGNMQRQYTGPRVTFTPVSALPIVATETGEGGKLSVGGDFLMVAAAAALAGTCEAFFENNQCKWSIKRNSVHWVGT